MSCFRLSFAKQKLRLELTSACSVNQLCSLEEEKKQVAKLKPEEGNLFGVVINATTPGDHRSLQRRSCWSWSLGIPHRGWLAAKRYRFIEACFNCNTTIVKPSFYPNTQQQHYHGQFNLYHRFPEPIQRVGYIRSTLSTRRMR